MPDTTPPATDTDGATVEDVLAEVPGSHTDVAGTTMLSSGGRAVIDLDLEPGEYALICYLPADASSSHAEHGMVHTFTVS